MSLIIPANSLSGGGFAVDNSARFDGSSYLHRTPSATGNPKKWTYSVWVKMAQENPGYFLSAGSGTQSKFIFGAYGGGDIDILTYEGYVILANTARLFRDSSSWYNIILAVDTTQSSYVNGLKLWVNGELQSLTLSSVGSENGYTQNTSLRVGTNNEPIHIGRDINDSGHWKGYMAECALVNDAQLDADQFGEFDEDSGIWKPIDISGLTFGTNGFYLDFKDSSAFGNDVSGNNNDFTVVGLAAIDQSTDTCTNNFATFNPLDKLTTGAPTGSEGNLKLTGNTSSNNTWNSTIGLSAGKWYVEMKVLQSTPDTSIVFRAQTNTSGSHNNSYGFDANGSRKLINGLQSGSAIGSTSQNDILGMALDLDNGKMFIHRNGTYLSSGDPANGTNPFIVTADGMPTEGVIGGHIYDGAVEWNFGSPSFAISSGNTDPNGYGNFEYPTNGYYALNTKNLSEFG